MKTIIFKTASTYLLPLLILFSVFILLRGHYLPGGGFVGGLIASIAFVIHSFANGLEKTKKIIKFHPGFLMPIGLAIALVSGAAPLLIGQSLMTGLWFEEPIAVIGMVGSALFFDTGVYLVVIGVTLTIIFTITETI
ncbi:multisubunit Na+/H+ antiporter, MnhB subunit [Belliella baltica DSM 15883]|uniref:Multisubunit Na+/H+ antiporter, MnhB subunit n=1 Tax=Belliella baltica (strain DSM 15883 / CIP 108006 / LMG 21964 / BA134) TaxID=866536 RepID=I3Z8P7_BELBD|nr:Na+/H+ antiporter subunit B [Belliella baltica]AFL85615.1 multisubunit Na+/H+ antiporter, MnhB subunit [Belliella baltica DSM 15883]